MSKKYVYHFGEAYGKGKELLGGKGANQAVASFKQSKIVLTKIESFQKINQLIINLCYHEQNKKCL